MFRQHGSGRGRRPRRLGNWSGRVQLHLPIIRIGQWKGTRKSRPNWRCKRRLECVQIPRRRAARQFDVAVRNGSKHVVIRFRFRGIFELGDGRHSQSRRRWGNARRCNHHRRRREQRFALLVQPVALIGRDGDGLRALGTDGRLPGPDFRSLEDDRALRAAIPEHRQSRDGTGSRCRAGRARMNIFSLCRASKWSKPTGIRVSASMGPRGVRHRPD